MAVSIRQANVDDAEAIATAHMRAWQDAYRGMIASEFLDAMQLGPRIEHWRDNLAADTLPNGWPAPTDYVAEADGHVVGFANLGIWREAPDDETLAEVWAIYVHPDHWGTGAGFALMNQGMTHFREASIETAYLWVLEDNVLARRFYERQGWEADDVTKEEEMGGSTIVERRYSIHPAK